MLKKFISTMIILCSVFIVGCSSNEDVEKILSRTEVFMGTVITVKIYDESDEMILDKVFEKVKEIEETVSTNKENTELQELNNNAGKSPIKLGETAYTIIKKAYEYSRESEGSYDLTVGPLVKLWSIGLPEAKVPTEVEISEIISKVDYSKVIINDETKEVFLEEEGMEIDLGSIAKGYAADEIVKLLKEEGVEEAIIDLGGNIYALGLKGGEEDWTIGIQNPFSDRGDVVGIIGVSNKSVVTSGVYERYIEEDGVKYHHILNPKTGYPYETDLAGITIIAQESIDADALSTVIFTKDIKEGIDYVEEYGGVEAIFITNEKEVYLTSGIVDVYEHISEEFVIKSNDDI